tara:strand:- start:95 stop:277 length:183 start_codon:yes stop_codon:yes gene_type:complete
MIIVCDTFSYEDHPVYVSEREDVREKHDKKHGKNMQKVVEAYNLKMNMEQQLSEYRAFHF